MNTVQLTQRLAARLAVEDSANLSAEQALDVLAAINAGIQEFYCYAPPLYRRTTLSHALRAPAAVTLTFPARYAHTVAAGTFSVAQFGCTVRFTGEAADTEVTGTNSVLDDFLGETLEQPATVYHDVVPLQDVIERIVREPRLYEATRREPTTLVRNERLRGGARSFWRDDTGAPWRDGLQETAPVGKPRYYWLDAVGMSQGGEPEFLLRVYPAPAVDYTIRIEAELGPRPVTFAQLSEAAKVSVPENRVESILVPLCEAALTSSRWWREPREKAAVLERAEFLKTNRLGGMSGEIAPPRNRVLTPGGF